MEIKINNASVFSSTGNAPWVAAQPTLVFIHGAGMDHSVWLAFARYFARRQFNVLALDLPGHGRSGGAPLATIEAMADWVVDVLDAAKIERATLVGHSMGAIVAFDCAARHAARIEKIVLLGFSYPMAVGPPLLDAAKDNNPAAIDMMVIYGHDFRSQLGGNRVSGVHVVNTAKRILEKNTPGVLFNDLNACNSYQNEAAAAAITCPVVLASGDRDKMTAPRAAIAMASAVADGKVVLIEGSGHGVMAEQPERTHRVLVDALRA